MRQKQMGCHRVRHWQLLLLSLVLGLAACQSNSEVSEADCASNSGHGRFPHCHGPKQRYHNRRSCPGYRSTYLDAHSDPDIGNTNGGRHRAATAHQHTATDQHRPFRHTSLLCPTDTAVPTATPPHGRTRQHPAPTASHRARREPVLSGNILDQRLL